MASFVKILECAERDAQGALAPLAGNTAEVAIPLREIFERLPVPEPGLVAASGPETPPPGIFAEKEEAPKADEQEIFPGRFGEGQTVLEPIVPSRGDLADAPEYMGTPVSLPEQAGEAEDVASLDDLDVGQQAAPEREPAGGPAVPAHPEVEQSGHAGEVDGLPSRHVPDFTGMGFVAEPMADLELRAIFSSHEVFTPQKAVERTAELPGVMGVVLFRRDGEIVASQLPPAGAAWDLGRRTPLIYQRTQEFAHELGFAGSEVFTWHTDKGIVSFFGQGQSCLAILQATPAFGPGMRERLMLIARGMASLLR